MRGPQHSHAWCDEVAKWDNASGRADRTWDNLLLGLRLTLRPLCPVHPRATSATGGLLLSWTRRARGAWLWPDGVDAPLHEQTEAYEVSYGSPDAPFARWTISEPRLELGAATVAELAAALPGGTLQVCQVGSYARSDPLLLTVLS